MRPRKSPILDQFGQPFAKEAPLKARRWEAADTTRLNEAHWANARETSVNVDLAERLSILRARCALEAASNPWVEGVITTHAADVVGPNGPTLQVQSDSEKYNAALEDLWRDWWADPTTRRDLSGPDLLRLWVRSLWLTGEILAQLTNRDDPPLDVTLALRPLNSRRLATPPTSAGRADVAMGVQLSPDGRPVAYHVAEPQRYGVWEITLNYRELAAAFVLHYFLAQEEDQLRGVPWLAPCLQPMADLRDYDDQTLDAARQAADQAVFWYTDHPDAEFLEVNETADYERRQQQTGPPGWKPQQLTPQQPTTVYTDYRAERLRELGRPVNMPLMTVRLDSAKHNYSSARFDGQAYARGLSTLQTWFSGGPLRRCVGALAAEARAGRLIPPAPKRVTLAWTWPVRPHVDPRYEAIAERTRLQNGTLTYAGALAAHGLTIDNVIPQRQRETQLLADAGLPPTPTMPTPPAAAPGQPAAKRSHQEPHVVTVPAIAARTPRGPNGHSP